MEGKARRRSDSTELGVVLSVNTKSGAVACTEGPIDSQCNTYLSVGALSCGYLHACS